MSLVITVVVPVFKHWHLMPAFFEKINLQNLNREYWHLLVVDNGSPEVPAQDELPDFVTLLTCSTPGSYAARNTGLQHATGELIIFTDADCQPEESWLEEHWKAYQLHGEKTLNAGAVKVAKLSPGVPNDYELFDAFLGIPQERYATQRGYAVTANLAIPRKIFELVGVFDETRFSGGDAEFCQRALNKGAKLRYVPGAKVLHPARATWQELETKARRVKGGQLSSGSFLRRVGFFFKSFFFPFIAGFRVIRRPMAVSEKKRILRVVARLGVVEIREVFLLLLGKSPERR